MSFPFGQGLASLVPLGTESLRYIICNNVYTLWAPLPVVKCKIAEFSRKTLIWLQQTFTKKA